MRGLLTESRAFPLLYAQLMSCANIAAARAVEVTTLLQDLLKVRFISYRLHDDGAAF